MSEVCFFLSTEEGKTYLIFCTEFEKLAVALCEITEGELKDVTKIEQLKENMFYRPLWYIHEADRLKDEYHLRRAILWLLDDIMSNMKIAGDMLVVLLSFLFLSLIPVDPAALAHYRREMNAVSRIPFALPVSRTYKVIRGSVRCCGTIEQRNQNDMLSKPFPLLMISVCVDPVAANTISSQKMEQCSSGNEGPSWLISDVPKLLLQLVVAYQKYPSRKSYTAFVMSCHGVSLRIAMARVSNAYMMNIWNADLSDETRRFHLFLSDNFVLRRQDGRREALRLIMGILRYLSFGDQSECQQGRGY